MSAAAKELNTYRKYWAARFGIAPFLPMSRAEMEQLGWDSCDVIIVTGDAYVDHPSFGMAIMGRLLEAQGFRVGIIAQPDWQSAEPFKQLGRPNLFFGITAGNMDSMVNRYTSDKRIRSDDAYTPGGVGGKRPDRSVVVYAQRAREAFKDVPIVIGGIEASLRRIAHFDYWSEKVRRRVLLDAKADLLVFGNAERQICRDRASPRGRRGHHRDHRPARHRVRAQVARLHRDRFDSYRYAREAEPAHRSVCDGARDPQGERRGRRSRSGRGAAAGQRSGRQVRAAREERRSRAQRDPHAVLRAGDERSGAVRARHPHPASRSQPRQCARAGAAAWRSRRVAEPAADSANYQATWTSSTSCRTRACRIRATATPRSRPTR